MKGHLKGRNLADEEDLLSVLSELMGEVLPDMTLRISADWRWTAIPIPSDGRRIC
jgi:hypothetical protein